MFKSEVCNKCIKEGPQNCALNYSLRFNNQTVPEGISYVSPCENCPYKEEHNQSKLEEEFFKETEN